MNSQTDSNMLCKLKKCADKLCSMKVKDDLSFSMTVTSSEDDGTEQTCFYKKINGNTEFKLMKALAAIAAVGLVMSLLCSLCSLIKKK